jgi:hypothetical protein
MENPHFNRHFLSLLPLSSCLLRFSDLVAGRPPEQLALAIQRIRTFNASVLASENKKKLQVGRGRETLGKK